MELSRQEYPALLVSENSRYRGHIDIHADHLHSARFHPIKQYLCWMSESS